MKKDQSKNIIVILDTSSNQEVTVGLIINGNEVKRTEKYETNRSQVVLPLIKQLLEEYALRWEDITAIEVHEGPGSFTGLRVGVSIANTLGYYLGIPINGKPVRQLLEPRYT